MIRTEVPTLPPPGCDTRPAPRETPGSGRLLGPVLVFVPSALLTLAMSLAGLGARGLSDDEYATWQAATLSLDAVVAPYYLLMHGWIAMAGESETTLRVPSAVLMGISAGLVSLIGRRLFDAGAGLTAGLLVAGLPAVARLGQEARPQALALATTVLAVLLLLRAREQPTRWRWLLAGCCLLAALLLGAVTPEPQLFGSRPVAAVVVAAALPAATLLWSRHRWAVTLLLAWALVPMAAGHPSAIPAWVLLAGALGHALVRFSRGTGSVALSLTAMLVVAAVFFVSGPGQQAARHSPAGEAPDFRSVAAVLTSYTRPDDGLAYAGTGRDGGRALDYELRRAGLSRDVLMARASTTDRVWLVSATGPHQDPLTGLPADTRAHLRASFARSEFQSFAYVRIFVLNRTAPR